MESGTNPGITVYIFSSARKLSNFHPSRAKLRLSDRRKVEGFIEQNSVESMLCYERMYLSILGRRKDNKDPYVMFFEIRTNSVEDYVLKNRVDWSLSIKGKTRSQTTGFETMSEPSQKVDLDLLLDIELSMTDRLEKDVTFYKSDLSVPFDEISKRIAAYNHGRWKLKEFTDPVQHLSWVCTEETQILELDGYEHEGESCDTRTMTEFVTNRLSELQSMQEEDPEELEACAKRLASDSTLIDLEGYLEIDLEWAKTKILQIEKLTDPAEYELAVQNWLDPIIHKRIDVLEPYAECIIEPSSTIGPTTAGFSIFKTQYELMSQILHATPKQKVNFFKQMPNIGWTKYFYWKMLKDPDYFVPRFEYLVGPSVDSTESPHMNRIWRRDEESPEVVQTLMEELAYRWAKLLISQNDSILKTKIPMNKWAGNRILVDSDFSAWEMTGQYGVGISGGTLTVVDVKQRDSMGRSFGYAIRRFKNADIENDKLGM